MMEAQLNASAKAHFVKDLHGFVRQKIEVEGVWDYEVAHMLNVKQQYIGELRRRLGIDRTKGFSSRFDRKYGSGAVSQFKQIIENPEKSLADVGAYFGFSREYARQVYWKIYGCSYGEKHGKTKARKRNRRTKTKQPYKLEKVRAKMMSMGFHPEIETRGRTSRILVNGYRLGLKLSRRPRKVGTRDYFNINQKNCFEGEHCDFFICLLKRKCNETHFIIPQTVMPKCSIALSPQSDKARSKYSKFKEAWHLLEKGVRTQVGSS